MDYASTVWAHACGVKQQRWLNRAQRVRARATTGAFRTTALAVAEAEANIPTIEERHAQAGTRPYINPHALPTTHPIASLKPSRRWRFMSPMRKLAIKQEDTAMERMEVIHAYTGDLEAIATALRSLPDELHHRDVTVTASSRSAL